MAEESSLLYGVEWVGGWVGGEEEEEEGWVFLLFYLLGDDCGGLACCGQRFLDGFLRANALGGGCLGG